MNNPSWSEAQRLGGLRRFAIAISILNLLGHTVFGFEQAWITPLLGLASAYSTELLFEVLDAMLIGRRPKFRAAAWSGSSISFSGPHQGTGRRHAAICERAAAAGGVRGGHSHRIEKHLPRADRQGDTSLLQSLQLRHLPGVIICTGSFLNWRFTKRLPLIAAWLSCFVAQALLRHWLFGARRESALLPRSSRRRGVHSY